MRCTILRYALCAIYVLCYYGLCTMRYEVFIDLCARVVQYELYATSYALELCTRVRVYELRVYELALSCVIMSL